MQGASGRGQRGKTTRRDPVFVLAAAVQAWLRLRRGDMDGARSAGLRTAHLLALPLIAWLSSMPCNAAGPDLFQLSK